ncbi:MAG: sulfatase-like hydrolase/transferase [Clostridia bacterium]|nr:sulfatase-like hydrolase/transferase [Clostridia bacterium]
MSNQKEKKPLSQRIKDKFKADIKAIKDIPSDTKKYFSELPSRMKTWGTADWILAVIKVLRIVVTLAALVGFPYLAYTMQESFYYSVKDMNAGMFEYNLLFVYLVELFILALTWSPRWALFGTTLMCGVLGVTQYAVMLYRFTPIMPWDILSIGTGLSVVDNYEFVWNEKIKIWVAVYIAMLIVSLVLLAKPKKPRIGKWPVRILCAVLCLFMMGGYVDQSSDEDFQNKMGYYPYLFTPTVVYRRNGFYFSFTSLLKYLNIEEPKGYDPDKLADEANDLIEAERQKGQAEIDEENKMPNIIVIMNEAFSDIEVHGDIDTDGVEIMPFINSLTENTVKGWAYSSVKGGNTPNSEFEFLTGDTMAFLPAGSIPYQQYLKGETPNFMSQLANLGYKTYGVHPYNASGWQRDTVYPMLGISESFFNRDFLYPKRVRSYISDESVYDMIKDLTNQNRGTGKPTAVFAVTMQNHGGYTDGHTWGNFEQDVEIYNIRSTSASRVSTYMSLVKLSDSAFEGLVRSYENDSTPTVILMFGDHQPNDSVTTPVLNAFGKSKVPANMEELAAQYVVPFVMWANYDIEEQSEVVTSLNYLNIFLTESAGLELSEYQLFRRGLMEEYPVMTANFAIDNDGNIITVDAMQGENVETYKKLQYAHLFDRDRILKNFYE